MTQTYYSEFHPSAGGSGTEGTISDDTVAVTGSKTVTATYTYTGAAVDGMFPLYVNFKLISSSDVELTGSAIWVATTVSGSAAYTIGSSTGVLEITGVTSDALIEVSATYGGVIKYGYATALRVDTTVPIVGGGGSTGSTANASYSAATITSTYGGSATAPVLTVLAGATGMVDLSGNVNYKRTTNGSNSGFAKWMWRIVGGSWADVASETSAWEDAYKVGMPEPENYPGVIYPNVTKTGLTSGTAYEFGMYARTSAGTNTSNGTINAIGY